MRWSHLLPRGILLSVLALVSVAAQAERPRTGKQGTQVILSSEILAQLKQGVLAQGIAQKHGLYVRAHLTSDSDWVVFGAYDIDAALQAERRLKADPNVKAVGNNSYFPTRKTQAAFLPNDPFYAHNNPVGTPGQWNLSANASGYQNLNVQAAWSLGATGSGQIIGIVDDAFEETHPDLAANADIFWSYDFWSGDDDPQPGGPGENHGTLMAGVAAAFGGNSLGVTGAAPRASFAGMAWDGGTVSQLVDAMLRGSSGPAEQRKVTIKVIGAEAAQYFTPNPLYWTALETVANARTIVVVPAGNRSGFGELGHSTTNAIASHQSVLVIGQVDSTGVAPDNALQGSNLLAVAPTSVRGESPTGIRSTDRTGDNGVNNSSDSDTFPNTDYTARFGGTSAAAAQASGVIALMRQRAPALDGRLAKHLFARTSKVVDRFDTRIGGREVWKRNGGGYWFNHSYGFGLMDAGELVRSSSRYYSSLPKVTRTISGTVNQAIPDGNDTGITRTFFSGATIGAVPLEDITIRLKINHAFAGDIAVFVTSPHGVERCLFAPNLITPGGIDFEFTSNAFWGENPLGTWKIRVADELGGDAGTWVDFTATLNFGAPGSRLGNALFSFDPSSTAQSLTGLWNGRSYTTVSLPPRPTLLAPSPQAFGDLDRDGRNDILYVLGNGELAYMPLVGYDAKPVVRIGTIDNQLIIFGIGDINRDGLNDVVVRNIGTREVSYFPLNGAGTALLGRVSIGFAPAGTVPFAVVDSTGDGQADIILDKTTSARAIWIWQLLPGGAPFGFIFSGFQVNGFSLVNAGDLNFDNQPDFIALNTTTGAAAGYTMNVLTVTTVSTLASQPAGQRFVGAAAL